MHQDDRGRLEVRTDAADPVVRADPGDPVVRTDPADPVVRTGPGTAAGGVDPLRAEVELLRVEADRLSAQADPLHAAGILLIGESYAPEPGGAAEMATLLARDLAATAERVVMFTGTPSEPGAGAPRWWPRPRRTFDHDCGVHLVRHRHRPRAGQSRLALTWSERAFLRDVLATPVRNPPDLVIGLLPSAGAAMAAARVARRFGVPLLLVVQDLEHDHRSPGDAEPADTALARGRLDALRQAVTVVVPSRRLRAAVVSLGVEPGRVELVEDWSPPPAPAPEPAVARARLGLPPDGFVVVHTGNIGPEQDVPALVEAARMIAGSSPSSTATRFLVVGEGSHRAPLESAAADRPEVRFLDPVTAGRYPALLAAADVLVVLERPGYPDRTLLGRVRSSIRAGRPIVAAVDPDGEAAAALAAVPAAALVVPAGDPRALASALVHLRDDPEVTDRMSAAARAYAAAAQGRRRETVGPSAAGRSGPGSSAAGRSGSGSSASGPSASGPGAAGSLSRLRDIVRAALTGTPRRPAP
jgi:colanic acid biosynthesis glycosyl transferase WcaI